MFNPFRRHRHQRLHHHQQQQQTSRIEETLEPAPRDELWQDGERFGNRGVAAVKERLGMLISFTFVRVHNKRTPAYDRDLLVFVRARHAGLDAEPVSAC